MLRSSTAFRLKDMLTTNLVSLEHNINKFLLLDQQINDGHIFNVWPAILSMCYPFLAHKHLRDCLIIVVLRGWHNKMKLNAYHFVEVFAGCANLTLELLRGGYRGSAFDIVFESCHNALSRNGLRLLLDAITSLREGGLVWIATQCSSFVVLCRHQSQRCEANGFLGNTQRPFVVLGNHLMEISCILFLVAHLVGLHVVIEQPGSSVMPLCRSMRSVLEVTTSRKFSTYMGSFNGPSVKPLQLWSPWPKVALLEREKPVGIVTDPLVIHHGDQFTGCKDKLAESQQYTCEFGQAVMEICKTEWSS